MEGKELTIEQLQERLAAAEAEKAKLAARNEELTELTEKAEAEKAELAARNEKLASLAQKAEVEKAEKAPLAFTTEDGTVYEFTCPTFTWDDGRIIDPKKLAKEKPEELAEIAGHLINRNSGIIRRKEAK